METKNVGGNYEYFLKEFFDGSIFEE